MIHSTVKIVKRSNTNVYGDDTTFWISNENETDCGVVFETGPIVSLKKVLELKQRVMSKELMEQLQHIQGGVASDTPFQHTTAY